MSLAKDAPHISNHARLVRVRVRDIGHAPEKTLSQFRGNSHPPSGKLLGVGSRIFTYHISVESASDGESNDINISSQLPILTEI